MNIVVKISSNLINPDNSIDVLDTIACDIEKLKAEGHSVVIVTSGAVMYGMKALKLVKRPDTVPLLQTCASIGQIALMTRFQKTFEKYSIIPGEILLSTDDFNIRSRYLNLRNTIKTLLSNSAVPVINENDTINIEELKLGDNDHLSSLISIMLDFDMLIILTDVDGLYNADPKKTPKAQLIEHVESIDDGVISLASDSTSLFTTGGMKKKLISASKAAKSGIQVFIGNGFMVSVKKVVSGTERGTYIQSGEKISARKKWIAFAPGENASISIDDGAHSALLNNGASLLASGITSVQGAFLRGALISIFHETKKIAQGLSNYSSEELELIKGKKSKDIQLIISDYYEEVIHKNNLYLL
ncbi:MAG: glutamate 5-kinase [Spirochaetes bacterium GWF1_31_7]|nr:MAG: glutamate 5-kinase [Spirochaetes bacterium GWE1_32_154]OHD48278.1 MAG: glutamate 5-kinase [Spirochaetes bacterium GWF1_31_7]OHD51843.1 MAG: glutamate 5-kinase [Spirochaetes bacterium GWE2_31_10]OHD79476.1 MAG: glutamate 5-kinase [Spirochaetes bacterium RIFOXYB1_FULL_32_8]HBD94891.1 glutamate 5-kinase [Spirochaetia bacterium]